PTQPLLERRTKEPIPENPAILFSNEPPDVILEYMRLMKAEASGAEASEAKSTDGKKATETAATEDVGDSEAKETDKGKGPEAITIEVKPATKKDKRKVVKKPMTVKKRAPKVQWKIVISDSEETEDEQPMFKRKRTELVQKTTEEADPEKAQPASENMDTEADT
ncbi:hypothetical protein A2U01_0041491, partial [Trifolium medium]|nr:hypothetical protein [Trifolium medium]